MAIPGRTNIALRNLGKKFQTGADKIEPGDYERLISAGKNLSSEAVLDFLIDRKSTKSRQVRDIVPITEWLRDEYYLGDESRTLYRFWEDVIVEFSESEKNELIIGTQVVRVVMLRANTGIFRVINKLVDSFYVSFSNYGSSDAVGLGPYLPDD
jgi:hypothetical protein